MDKKLHKILRMSSDIGKLDRALRKETFLPAFLFEPKDLIDFDLSLQWQRNWQKKMLNGIEDRQAIWLLQHRHCYTLGRGASESNVLFDVKKTSNALFRIDRGGEVTYHLPGQLVAYLVLDLQNYGSDLHWYLRELEQVIIDTLFELGLLGERIDGLTGVWIQGCKVASIGVGCRRWITQHGLSLNIDCDLRGFDEIVPCGIQGHPMGRLNSWLPDITVKDVQPVLRKCLKNRFALKWSESK